MKNSTTVVILFEGLRVPNYAMCGPSIVKYTLYRRQTDVCYTCGRLGHRADVCPTPGNVICHGCGMTSPGDQHVCSPKCAFLGGPHSKADRTCTQKFEIPYIVRQRRRERRNFDKDFPPIHHLSEPANKSRSQSRSSRGRSRYKSGPDTQAVPSPGAVPDHGARPSAFRCLLPQRPSGLTASKDPRNR
ncbi:hypothetical protein HPB51_001660 [Rhipicephalus microplus]|uniref:CCHC-type domain-containing protein n=1 Tax=Rhipicephalus microplus TaxID=6941 RepID=A0A9J6EWA8_RHIMP|nr:hypothetical protein HPB51_001660 [Rhipicephalus microplus]